MSSDRKKSLEMKEVEKSADVAEKAEPIREFKSSGQKRLLVTGLAKLRAESLLCDVVLIAEGTRINAHRVVLAASSDYFRTMFTNDVVESRSREIEMVDIEASALVALTDFCYSGKIMIGDVNVQNILSASCLLQIKEVQAYCCEFLKGELCLTNFSRIRALADRYACQELLGYVDNYVLHNFEDIVSSEEFNTLPFERLLELVSNADLQVRSEEQVFAAVLQWVEFNLEDRKQFLSKLLEHVRLYLCDPKFLVNTVGKNALVEADRACRKLVNEVKLMSSQSIADEVEPATAEPPRPNLCASDVQIPSMSFHSIDEVEPAAAHMCTKDSLQADDAISHEPLSTSHDSMIENELAMERLENEELKNHVGQLIEEKSRLSKRIRQLEAETKGLHERMREDKLLKEQYTRLGERANGRYQAARKRNGKLKKELAQMNSKH